MSCVPTKISITNSGAQSHKIASIAAGFASSYFLRSDKYLFMCGDTGAGKFKSI